VEITRHLPLEARRAEALGVGSGGRDLLPTHTIPAFPRIHSAPPDSSPRPNRIYKYCGLERLEQLEDAPEYDSKVVLNADLIKQYLAEKVRSRLMARDAFVPEEFAKKFAPKKRHAYARWVRSEGLDIIGATTLRTCAPPRSSRGQGAEESGVYLITMPRGPRRLLRVRNPARQKLARSDSCSKRDYVLAGRGFDDGLERRGPAHPSNGRRVRCCDPSQRLAPPFQRIRQGTARYVAVTNAPASSTL